MARRRRNLPAKQPVTKLPGMAKPKPAIKPYYAPVEPSPPPTSSVVAGVPSINLDRLLIWIASAGSPTDAGHVQQFYPVVEGRIRALRARPSRGAVSALPDRLPSVNFNGAELVKWINRTDDVASLQKVWATMRLRIRQAAWLKRKGK